MRERLNLFFKLSLAMPIAVFFILLFAGIVAILPIAVLIFPSATKKLNS